MASDADQPGVFGINSVRIYMTKIVDKESFAVDLTLRKITVHVYDYSVEILASTYSINSKEISLFGIRL